MIGPAEHERDRRELAERLFDEARALPALERASFIAAACSGDDALRTELEELLAHSAAAQGFFALLSDAVMQPAPQAGLIADRYEISACLGVGGMGAVYRARDARLQRDVALKFLPLHYAAAPGAQKQLLEEARAAAALEHPNVCTVHEIAMTEDGLPFISMAFYDGETLKQRLARGAIPLAEAVEIARQLTRGLAAAHAHGIVHRDVKPGNVMLLRDGTVKLLDFGLACMSDAHASSNGVTPGTVAYMSPEQARGDALGPGSDLFSLGVVLHEMIAGGHPFRSGDPHTVIESIVRGEPEPPRKRNPAAPRSLERIVSRLLEKDAAARYANADDLLVDLERVSTSIASAPRLTGFNVSRLTLTLVLVILAAGGTSSWWALRGPQAPPGAIAAADDRPAGAASTLPAKTVAVLPFTSLSRDPEDDYLVDGLTEELIGALSKVRALRVVARTSAFVFKGADGDVREIGDALGAGTILKGTVQRAGVRIRVRAQLINVADGLHIWSDTYDRAVTDIFELQQDLALRIAKALEAELTPDERKSVGQRPTTSPEAFALYLKGRHFYKRRTRDGFLRAIDYYQRAIATDSQFAAAYAGLAAVYSLQGIWEFLTPAVARQQMRDAALRAIQLDDQLPEAHAVWGAYLHVYEWDTEQAERAQLRAIELDSRFVLAHFFYGNLLRSHGRFDEAIGQYRTAVELDPLDPLLIEVLGRTLLLADRPEEAREHFNSALELDSMFWWPHAGLGLYYETKARWTEALQAFRRAEVLKGSARADIARVLARAGRAREARQLLAELQRDADRMALHDPTVASALLALGDRDGAFAWLERSYSERHPKLRFIAGSTPSKGFETEPRYLELLRRIGVKP